METEIHWKISSRIHTLLSRSSPEKPLTHTSSSLTLLPMLPPLSILLELCQCLSSLSAAAISTVTKASWEGGKGLCFVTGYSLPWMKSGQELKAEAVEKGCLFIFLALLSSFLIQLMPTGPGVALFMVGWTLPTSIVKQESASTDWMGTSFSLEVPSFQKTLTYVKWQKTNRNNCIFPEVTDSVFSA